MPTNITHNQPIKISGQHNIYDVGYKDIYKDDSQSDICEAIEWQLSFTSPLRTDLRSVG